MTFGNTARFSLSTILLDSPICVMLLNVQTVVSLLLNGRLSCPIDQNITRN